MTQTLGKFDQQTFKKNVHIQGTPQGFQKRTQKRQLAKTPQIGEGVIHGFAVVFEASKSDNKRAARGEVIRACGQTEGDIGCERIQKGI